MSGTPVRLGLVGCGRLAQAGYLPALTAVPEVRLAAVADPDSYRRAHVARLAAELGVAAGQVAATATVAELVSAAALDVVVVASPPTCHVADAATVTKAGIPVLVEKPPAPDTTGAAALQRLDPAPWIGLNRRFDPGIAAVAAAIPAQGHVRLEIELAYRRRSWRPFTVADDVLDDLGPHAIDLARWLTGSEVVEANSGGTGATRADFHLQLERARAHVRLATDRPHHEVVAAYGDRGQPLARHRLGGLVAGVRARLRPAPGPTALVTSIAGELQALATAARGGPSGDLATAADGVVVMQVIAAVRASAESGGLPATSR